MKTSINGQYRTKTRQPAARRRWRRYKKTRRPCQTVFENNSPSRHMRPRREAPEAAERASVDQRQPGGDRNKTKEMTKLQALAENYGAEQDGDPRGDQRDQHDIGRAGAG